MPDAQMISDLSTFANLPLGGAALWVAWKLGLRYLKLEEHKLEQAAAREIAERNERIQEAANQREERREERAERRFSTETLVKLTDGVGELGRDLLRIIKHLKDANAIPEDRSEDLPTPPQGTRRPRWKASDE